MDGLDVGRRGEHGELNVACDDGEEPKFVVGRDGEYSKYAPGPAFWHRKDPGQKRLESVYSSDGGGQALCCLAT